MIEKTILDYLNSTLSVPAYMEEPEQPPESYVLVEKTGSRSENRIKESTIAIQSYGTSLYKAAILNEAVLFVMENSITLPDICRCSLNSDYNFTDSETHRYRYQAVFELTHY